MYEEDKEEAMPSTIQMRKNMKNVMNNWNLGPKVASEDPKSNKAFWRGIAIKWAVSEQEGRYRNCGNCEYGETDPEDLKKMSKYPFSKFDADGGGRVWCEKFDFVCHNLRVCQSWMHKDNDYE